MNEEQQKEEQRLQEVSDANELDRLVKNRSSDMKLTTDDCFTLQAIAERIREGKYASCINCNETQTKLLSIESKYKKLVKEIKKSEYINSWGQEW